RIRRGLPIRSIGRPLAFWAWLGMRALEGPHLGGLDVLLPGLGGSHVAGGDLTDEAAGQAVEAVHVLDDEVHDLLGVVPGEATALEHAVLDGYVADAGD